MLEKPKTIEELCAVADDWHLLRQLIHENPLAYQAWHHGRTLGWDDNRSMRAVVAALCYGQGMLLDVLAMNTPAAKGADGR